ncbi:MAG: hypothetical protein LQ343_007194 [Gyalolechia ehrenbergii]|nr:MAG: hypothetical protein LQ343_007194 [Gyalolechia ehrenbergii]
MAAEQDQGIVFSIAHDPQKVRLLELPPPLLDVLSSTDPPGPQGKQSILLDTPLSSQEFDQAWVDLCAFELEGRACLPTPGLLWKVWRSIISASTIKGLPLDKVLDVRSLASMVEDDEIPIPAFIAVIERLQDQKWAGQARTSRLSRRFEKVTKAR